MLRGVSVAHKIGELASDIGFVNNDIGIIFGQHADILVVVMNVGALYSGSSQTAVDIAKLSYETFDVER